MSSADRTPLGWITTAQEHLAMTHAARQLGYTARGNTITGCPACGEKGYGSSKIRRRPGQAEKWSCYRCGVGGDVVDFAAWHQLGRKAKGRGDHQQLQSLFAGMVPGIDYPEDVPAAKRRPPRRPPPRPPEAPEVGQRPPSAELLSLWAASASIVEDAPVADYLRARRMDPDALAALDLARALPVTYDWPAWWPHPKRAGFKDQRLAVQLYESNGTLATIQARSIDPSCPKKDRQKWPKAGPGSASGVFFADVLGLQLLRGALESDDINGVLIVEGLTDFLRVALVVAASGERLAVIAAANGSFEVLAEIPMPPGVPIYACPDEGDVKNAGERYAQLIGRAFGGDRVYRVHPTEALAEPPEGITDMDDVLAEDSEPRLRQLLQSARRRGPVRGAWECADPDVGMSELTLVTERAVGADTPEERRKPIVGLLRDPDAMRGLGAAWRTRQAEVTASLLELRDVPGVGRHLTQLQRQIQTSADELADLEATSRRRNLRLARDNEAPPALHEVLDDLVNDGYSLPPNLTVPPGWRVSPDGIYERKPNREGGYDEIRRLQLPLLVTGRLQDIATGATHLRLEWPRRGRWMSAVVSQAEATNARTVQALADQQAPVHSGNASSAVRWISELEIENDRTLPQALTSDHMGWHGGRGFVWGRHHLRVGGSSGLPLAAIEEARPDQWDPDHLHLHVTGADAALADGYHAHGDYQTWARGLEELLADHPLPWLILYAALAAPLLKGIQDAPPFIVSLEGDPGGGKSTALAIAASVWGCPAEDVHGPMVSWDNSPTRIEEIAGLLAHMPLILDDTKKCGEDADLISRVIYMVVGQQGKGRSNNFGTQKKQRAVWKTIMLSSGEAPLTAFSESGGTRARVLPLRGRPFGEDPDTGSKTAEAVLRLVLENYGHAGPRIVQWLLDTEDAGDMVRQLYAKHRSDFESRAAYDNTARRASRYLAVLKLGAMLAHSHSVLGLETPRVDPIMAEAWPAVEIAAQEADRAKVALSLTWSWINAHAHQFWGRHDVDKDGAPKSPSQGWMGAWKAKESWERIAVGPSYLDRFLREQGFKAPVEILTAWKRRGWLHVRANKPGLKYPATTPSGRSPHYVLNRTAVKSLGMED